MKEQQEKNANRKAKPWCRFRHKVIWKLVYPAVWLLTWVKYRPRLPRFRDAKKRQYLILMNHQTPFDQFFVSLTFGKPVYFIATEDIFSLGFLSGLLEYLVAPIPIRKTAMDLKTIKTCLQVVREGGNICIAPEGNTTYSGCTGYMKPGIAHMAKKFGLPIAIYKIEGGYGKHPRWADDIRKGPMRAGVSRVIEPEEYQKLSKAELLELLQNELHVDESVPDAAYSSEHLAEYLERAMYVCPDCGLSAFRSAGDRCTCQKCGRTIQYLPDKQIRGVEAEFPFRSVREWYDYQCEFINRLDPLALTQQPVYQDRVEAYAVTPCVCQELVTGDAELSLFGDRVELRYEASTNICRFSEISGAAVLGRNKLEFSIGGKLWQFRGDSRFNALKYLNFYHRYKNVTEEDGDVKFLGL